MWIQKRSAGIPIDLIGAWFNVGQFARPMAGGFDPCCVEFMKTLMRNPAPNWMRDVDRAKGERDPAGSAQAGTTILSWGERGLSKGMIARAHRLSGQNPSPSADQAPQLFNGRGI